MNAQENAENHANHSVLKRAMEAVKKHVMLHVKITVRRHVLIHARINVTANALVRVLIPVQMERLLLHNRFMFN